MPENILMVSADRAVVAGEKGPFHYMLEGFHRHWDRIDVIGTRPARVESTTVFGNVHLHHPTTGKLRQAAFIARTGRALAGERPYTVITSHDYNPFYNGLGSWRISKATGIPYVAEIHHVPGHPRPASLRERLDRIAVRRYVRWASKRAAGFRVVNGVELPALLRGWGVPDHQVHVLRSLYLDTDAFRPADDPQLECDILLVGRLEPNKGVLDVLEAVRRLCRRGLSEVRLRMVGRGPDARRVDAFVERHGLGEQVTRIDWLPDALALAKAYRSARVLVCASYSEGGPRVVAEAMACGTPVLSTPVGIVPEIVHHGRNGLLYDGRVSSLTLALQRFLTDVDLQRTLRSNLPGDFSPYRRHKVLEDLASGLKTIARAARGR